jgi:5-(carboxyamino)imidazole ribonucleotide synthase
MAAAIAQALAPVGVMAVEMFVLATGAVLVNEIAPRVHNSGHFTLGACVSSQFEQHVRAVLRLPLGDPSLVRPVVMVNLLGDLWADGEPDWEPLRARADVRLHLYGKGAAHPGRKMGHFLLFDDDGARAQALHAALAAPALQGRRPRPHAA